MTVASFRERPSIDRLPIEPLFVDREIEIVALDDVFQLLPRAIGRHTALLGLRCIGKTLLLDEVRRRHPQNVDFEWLLSEMGLPVARFDLADDVQDLEGIAEAERR